MVVIVAALLSFMAEQLKPYQEKNVEVEKKLDILRSVRLARDMSDVGNKNDYVEEAYAENISRSFVINPEGRLMEDLEAFSIDLKEELAKPPGERDLPVFVYTDEEGGIKYVIPLRGKGLWGPIWGYISLDEDLSTIYGATFSHTKETPGLGAEINQLWFQEQFFGKKIFDEAGDFTSVKVEKGGADPDDAHAVDAISGGTITSKGVEAMLKDCLGNYLNYFKENSN